MCVGGGGGRGGCMCSAGGRIVVELVEMWLNKQYAHTHT